jgi:hypothetical protein
MKYISPLFSDARASVGGATFSKNRGGNYVRAKVAPVQPRSTAQQEARANLSTLSAMWKGLTQTQIAGWNSLASSITLKDSLGNSYKPTGAQLYVGNNRNLSDIDETTVDDAPAASPSFADVTPLAGSAAAGTPAFTITTNTGAAPDGFVFLVRATPQLSPGKSYFGKSRYRLIGHFADTAYASLNVLDDYTARFGALVEGQQIAFAVSLIEIASGFQSIEATGTLLVAA